MATSPNTPSPMNDAARTMLEIHAMHNAMELLVLSIVEVSPQRNAIIDRFEKLREIAYTIQIYHERLGDDGLAIFRTQTQMLSDTLSTLRAGTTR